MTRAVRPVAALAALLAGLVLAAPAQALPGQRVACDPATRPASVQRFEHTPGGAVIAEVWVVRRTVVCGLNTGTWLRLDAHTREWKRYSRNAPGGFACQMWARDRAGQHRWSHWHDVPWGNATNC